MPPLYKIKSYFPETFHFAIHPRPNEHITFKLHDWYCSAEKSTKNRHNVKNIVIPLAIALCFSARSADVFAVSDVKKNVPYGLLEKAVAIIRRKNALSRTMRAHVRQALRHCMRSYLPYIFKTCVHYICGYQSLIGYQKLVRFCLVILRHILMGAQ